MLGRIFIQEAYNRQRNATHANLSTIRKFQNFAAQGKSRIRDRPRTGNSRAEENDERPEDRSSLPEPIFYEQPYVHLSSALVGIYLARARVPLRRVYTRR